MNTVSLEVMSPRLATVFTAVADNFAFCYYSIYICIGEVIYLQNVFVKSAC